MRAEGVALLPSAPNWRLAPKPRKRLSVLVVLTAEARLENRERVVERGQVPDDVSERPLVLARPGCRDAHERAECRAASRLRGCRRSSDAKDERHRERTKKNAQVARSLQRRHRRSSVGSVLAETLGVDGSQDDRRLSGVGPRLRACPAPRPHPVKLSVVDALELTLLGRSKRPGPASAHRSPLVDALLRRRSRGDHRGGRPGRFFARCADRGRLPRGCADFQGHGRNSD